MSGYPVPGEGAPGGVDSSVAQSARVWNYWLDGKDNYAADREAGDRVLAIYPHMGDVAKTSRAFLGRAVHHLVVEAGLRQFLDIGTGLPNEDNTHQIAQRLAPECRIVYTDNDPLVLAHARSLLTSTPEGETAYVHADLREPDSILEECVGTLDLSKPVGLMLCGILGHIPEADHPVQIVHRLLDGLSSGSYLVWYDGSNVEPDAVRAKEQLNERTPVPYFHRSPEFLLEYFQGLELLEPGMVHPRQWRSRIQSVTENGDQMQRAAVAYKP